MTGRVFLTASGRYIPEADTDQPGSEMLVRTVSRYTDGTAIDRPQVCVSPELAGGVAMLAEALARDLVRRGYLPPTIPMTRAEHAAIVATHQLVPHHAAIIWDVCGRGVPLGTALGRAKVPEAKRRNARVALQRKIKKIGWTGG